MQFCIFGSAGVNSSIWTCIFGRLGLTPSRRFGRVPSAESPGAFLQLLADQDRHIHRGEAQPLFGGLVDVDGVVADLVKVEDSGPDEGFLAFVSSRLEGACQGVDASVVHLSDGGANLGRAFGPVAHGGIEGRVIAALADQGQDDAQEGRQLIAVIVFLVVEPLKPMRQRVAIRVRPVFEQSIKEVLTVFEVPVEPATGDVQVAGQPVDLDPGRAGAGKRLPIPIPRRPAWPGSLPAPDSA